MTVNELIKKLNELSPDGTADVRICFDDLEDGEHYQDRIESVQKSPDGNLIGLTFWPGTTVTNYIEDYDAY